MGGIVLIKLQATIAGENVSDATQAKTFEMKYHFKFLFMSRSVMFATSVLTLCHTL